MLFFLIRLVCTHIIAYRVPDGIVWPKTRYWSLSDVPVSDIQYQVSAFTGCLALCMIYWYREGRKGADEGKWLLAIYSTLLVIASVCLELSFRVSYCTDLFAALFISHLVCKINNHLAPVVAEFIQPRLKLMYIKQYGTGDYHFPSRDSRRSALLRKINRESQQNQEELDEKDDGSFT